MLADLLEKMGVAPGDDKPVVGASACLLGRPVRYNGETKYHAATAEALTDWVTLSEFCPEVAIGLPVPRPPIQVVQIGAQQRVRGVADPEADFTPALHACADGLGFGLDGFVLKARSPSCGLDTTPLFDEAGRESGVTSGAFAASLKQRLPLLPLCDESLLEQPHERERFILRVWLYHLNRQGEHGAAPAAARLPGSWRKALAPWLEELLSC